MSQAHYAAALALVPNDAAAATASADTMNAVRELVLKEDLSFASGMWFYKASGPSKTGCAANQAIVDGLVAETVEGWSNFITNCISTTVTPERQAVWEATLKAFGRVDIVVNGAGIFEPPSSTFWNPPGISPLSKDAVDAQMGVYLTFSVNTMAPIRLAQIALDYWLQNRDVKGNLLWVSSMGAYVHSIQAPLYFASKSAVLSVAKSLQGLKRLAGIRNSVICPGAVRVCQLSISPHFSGSGLISAFPI